MEGFRFEMIQTAVRIRNQKNIGIGCASTLKQNSFFVRQIKLE